MRSRTANESKNYPIRLQIGISSFLELLIKKNQKKIKTKKKADGYKTATSTFVSVHGENFMVKISRFVY